MKKEMNSQTTLLDRLIALCDEDKDGEAAKLIAALPAEEQTDEIKSLLGRALNNLQRYDEALDVLMSVKESQSGTAAWNFRVGYAYFYLKNYAESLRHFREALELNPEDDYAPWYIAQCELQRPFTQRVAEFWEWFGEHADEIERLRQKGVGKYSKETLQNLISQGADIIGNYIDFQMGGRIYGDHKLFFSTSCYANLFINPYIVLKAPAEIRRKWEVFSCTQPLPSTNITFNMHGKNINSADVMVAFEYNKEEKYFNLKYHNPSLAQLDKTESLTMFDNILQTILGTAPIHNYIKNKEQAESPEGMFPLTQLPEVMKRTLEENGIVYNLEPAMPYWKYERQPTDEDHWVRLDIIKGTTNCVPLVDQYYNEEYQLYFDFTSCGIAPMMLIIDQPDGMDTNDFIDYLRDVQDRINDLFQLPGDIDGMILGGAYGRCGRGYIDLLVYNNKAFMEYIGNPYCLYTLLKPKNGEPMPRTYVKEFKPDGYLEVLNDAQPLL